MTKGKDGWREKGGVFLVAVLCFLVYLFSSAAVPVPPVAEEKAPKPTKESWMGLYMEGIKVGYSRSLEVGLGPGGNKGTKRLHESWMKVSRLGGNPVEIRTVQESRYGPDGAPQKMEVRTTMSGGGEIVIQAEREEDRIVFRTGDGEVGSIPCPESFYLEIPVERILEEGGFLPGATFFFPVLDPLSRAVRQATFTVMGKEEILVLGERKTLWHVRTELPSLIPVVMEEWMDGDGEVWKSVSRASFLTTTSLRMSREKALEPSTGDFDIAFSSLIPSNVRLDQPRQVRMMSVRIRGVPRDAVERFPRDGRLQRILPGGGESFILETRARIFTEEEALSLPLPPGAFTEALQPTSFCQSDVAEITAAAREIVAGERNAWRAAKKIAAWVRREMTPNYDVGFATAKETFVRRRGDCSEYTVLTVALCRAAGIPARAAVGIMYAGGIFGYHMWPEVFVGQWVGLDARWYAVDAETGEPFTDATHILFGRSLLDEDMFQELVPAVSGIIGRLKLEILDFRIGRMPESRARPRKDDADRRMGPS